MSGSFGLWVVLVAFAVVVVGFLVCVFCLGFGLVVGGVV